MRSDAARLAVWNALLASIAEEMGVTLGLSSHSPNIRERRDYSCGVFDARGEMVAQAAHIPVHLGAMPEAIRAVQSLAPWSEGDIAIVNDPYLGGTHLPDISLVAPVFWEGELIAFLSNRAHHADVGGMSAGSMPLSRELYQEGVIIPPLRLFREGIRNDELMALILRNVRTPEERQGDFDAQLAALRTGAQRLHALCKRYGVDELRREMEELKNYTERLTRAAIAEIPDGRYPARDTMETPDGEDVEIVLQLTVEGEELHFDFSGTAPEQPASINAVAAVTRSAVAYCVRCLLPADAPSNEGGFRPLHFILPEGSLVNARPPRAVSAGNVETSQRVTDVVFRALAQALPGRIPAASAGSMNNFTFGGQRSDGSPFAYYETIPGGAGAGPAGDGLAGVQTHMTNTANTPVEAMERSLPVRIWRFELRDGSGGPGEHTGGDGVVKDVEALEPMEAAIVADRRRHGPWGLAGGGDGQPGRDSVRGDGEQRELRGHAQVRLAAAERLTIETPGGAGWGRKLADES